MRKYQSVLLSSVAILMLGAAQNAQAACTPTIVGGVNTVVCNPGTSEIVTGTAGTDDVIVKGGTVTSISTLGGDSHIDILSGTVTGAVTTGADTDIIKLVDGKLSTVNMGDGSNKFDLLSAGGEVTDITGGSGVDRITIWDGKVTGKIDAGTGANVVTVVGGTVARIDAGVGDDTVDWQGGQINEVHLGDGSDTLTIKAGASVGATMLDGGDDSSIADSMIDTLTANSVTLTNVTLKNWEVMNIGNSTVNGNLGIDGGTLTLNNTTVNGNVNGGNGDDNVTLNGNTHVTGNVDLGQGNNTATLNPGSVVDGNLVAGTGNDTLNLNGGTIKGDVNLGSGDNTANINTGTIGGNLITGDGKDTLTLLTGATIVGNVNLGGGENIANINGGEIKGNLTTGDAKDTLNLNGGTIGGNVNLGGGDNIANVNSGLIKGDLTTGSGNDTLNQTGGTIAGNVDLGNGTNVANISGGVIGKDLIGGTGADTLNLSGTAIIKGNANLGEGNNIANILGGQIDGNLIAGAGDDKLDMSGGTIGGNVNLGNGTNTATVSGGTINGQLLGGTGVDDVTVSGTANIVGGINLGDGANVLDVKGGTVGGPIVLGNGADKFTQSGGTVKDVDLGAGDDIAKITGGTIDGTLNLGDGLNVATISGGTITKDLIGGKDADTLNLSGTAVIKGNANLGDGNNIANVNGGKIDGNLTAGTGDDKMTMTAGTIGGNVNLGAGDNVADITGGEIKGQVTGGGGVDKVTLSGTGTIGGGIDTGAGADIVEIKGGTVGGPIALGEGADEYKQSGGTVKSIDLGAGDDKATISSGIIDGKLDLGAGHNIATISGGEIKGQVVGGANVDEVTVSGDAKIVGGIDLGAGADILAITGGTVTGPIALGEGADNYTQSGGAVGAVDLGGGEDVGAWTGGTLTSLNAGEGNDKFTVSSPLYKGTEVLDGGPGTDEITFKSINVQPADGTIINWESLKFVDSNIIITDKTITPPGGTAPKLDTLSGCGGTLTAGGALQVGTLSGCQTNDTLIATDNAKIDKIEAGGGSDIIKILGNAEVTGIVNSGGPGADNHAELDAGDIITIDTTKGVGGVDSGLGDDVVNWKNGTIGAAGIVLGDGKDALTIESAAYTGNTKIAGGAGDDTVTLKNLGTAAIPLTLTGASITGVEHLNLDHTAMKLSGGSLDLGSPASELRIANGSLFDGALGLMLNGSMSIDATSTFKAEGNGSSEYKITGDLTNKGLIDMKNGVVGDKIYVAGNYVGGGKIEMDFNSETLIADSITIDGNATGQTQLVVSNTSLLGKDTGPNGVTLVTVKGTQSADAFTLVSGTEKSVDGRIVGGAYLYGLVYVNGKWVLKSTLREASTSTIYLGTQTAEISRLMLGTRSERVGFQEREMNTAGNVYYKGKKVKSEGDRTYFDGSNFWGRAFGTSSKGMMRDSLNGNVENKQTAQALQFGADVLTYYGDDGSRGRVGMYGGYAMVQGDLSKGNINGGSMYTTGWGGGLYASWDSADDWYVDGVIQGHRTHAEGGKGTLSALNTNGTIWAGSVEGGKMFKISDSASFEAQAQMVFTAGGLEGGIDAAGQKVTYGNAPSVAARVGGRLKSDDLHMPNDNLWASGWLKADLWTTLPLGAQTMNIGATKVEYAQKSTWLDMGAALDIQAAHNVNFNIQASVEVGLDKQYLGAKGQIGARWEF